MQEGWTLFKWVWRGTVTQDKQARANMLILDEDSSAMYNGAVEDDTDQYDEEQDDTEQYSLEQESYNVSEQDDWKNQDNAQEEQ